MTTPAPICVDAGVVLSLVLQPDGGETAIALWRGWEADGRCVVAPSLLLYEVVNVLHRYVLRGELAPDEAADALDAVLSLGLDVQSDAVLHREALRWAGRLGLPVAYDAHYVAVAHRMGADMWTTDRRLHDRMRGERVTVHLVESHPGSSGQTGASTTP